MNGDDNTLIWTDEGYELRGLKIWPWMKARLFAVEERLPKEMADEFYAVALRRLTHDS